MSLFTSIRDAFESVASIAGNYVLPGSSLVTSQLVSKGAQEQLNSPLGRIANIASGVSGGAAGNIDKFGRAFDAGTNLFTQGATAGSLPAEALSASDPIEAMLKLDPEGTKTWTEIAKQYGFGSPEGLLSSINPSWINGVPLGGGSGPGGLNGGGLFPVSGGAPGGGPLGLSLGGNPLTTMQSWAKGTGSMPWGSPGNLFNIGSGAYGLYQADQLKKMALLAQQNSDPFGKFRGQYGDQLSGLMADPSKITTMPGYEAGLQAVQRAQAAQGFTGSGNAQVALAKYGGDFYDKAVSQLSGLAGAQFSPASAAQVGITGATNAASIGAQSLNRIGYGVQATQPLTPQQQMMLMFQRNGTLQ